MRQKKIKPSEGDWKVLRGNYNTYATINTSATKRICEVRVDVNDKHSGLAPVEEADSNLKVLAGAKDNYLALERIYKECCKALEASIVEGKRINFKKLVGAIGDCANDAIRKTKNK